MYIFKKNMLCLYIKFIYNMKYKNINVYACKYFQNTVYAVCECIYIYIINIHSTHTYIM